MHIMTGYCILALIHRQWILLGVFLASTLPFWVTQLVAQSEFLRGMTEVGSSSLDWSLLFSVDPTKQAYLDGHKRKDLLLKARRKTASTKTASRDVAINVVDVVSCSIRGPTMGTPTQSSSNNNSLTMSTARLAVKFRGDMPFVSYSTTGQCDPYGAPQKIGCRMSNFFSETKKT